MPRSIGPIFAMAFLLLVSGVAALAILSGGDETGPDVAGPATSPSPAATDTFAGASPTPEETASPTPEATASPTPSAQATASPDTTASPAGTASPFGDGTASPDDEASPDDTTSPSGEGSPGASSGEDDVDEGKGDAEAGDDDAEDAEDDDRTALAIDDLPETGGGAPAVLAGVIAMAGAVTLRRR